MRKLPAYAAEASCFGHVAKHRLTLGLALLLAVVSPAAAHPADELIIDVPAPSGVVSWEEIGVGIAEAAHIDGATVRDLLPDGRLRLRSSTAQFALVAVGLSTRGGIKLQSAEDAAGVPVLRITIDREWSRRQRSKLERNVRARRGQADPQHGCRLQLPEQFDEMPPGRELVLLMHGYNGTERSLRPLQARLEQAGFHCAVFVYPNDGALEIAAAGLSEQLRTLPARRPGLQVAIVAHSMGGLVARRVIEDEQLDPGIITRLIQIAPPNHGSNLAYLPFGLDVWEHLGPRKLLDFDGTDVLTAWIADGLEEGRHDVQPDSPWLARLNAQPRNPQVAYSILLGTDGPLGAEELQKLRVAWERLAERELAAELLKPRVDPLLAGDEWLAGRGDGVVSLSSGRLEGVQDVVVLPFEHDSIQDRLDGPAGRQLAEAVLARLPLTVASPKVPQVFDKKSLRSSTGCLNGREPCVSLPPVRMVVLSRPTTDSRRIAASSRRANRLGPSDGNESRSSPIRSSGMSQLSVFRPSQTDDSPRILSFATFAARIKSQQIFDVCTRAKLEHHNRVCPACGRVNVKPVELNDPLFGRGGGIIPRSATLAGFNCDKCGHIWSV